jgi:hypothetical protein
MRLKSFARTLALLTAGSSLLAIPLTAQTASPEPSIADAARQAREQKKAAAKPEAVVTNDTLHPIAAAPVSSTAAPSAATHAASTAATMAPTAENPAADSSVSDAAAPSASAQPALSPEDTEKLKSEIAAIKQQLKDKQGEMDVLQRLYDLDKESLYSKPDPTRDTAGIAKLSSEQDELKQKQEEFAKLKAELENVAPKELTEQAPPNP